MAAEVSLAAERLADIAQAPPCCAGGAGAQCDFFDRGVFPDRSGLVGEVRVFQCRRCGQGVSRPPMPDVAFLYADRESQDFQPRTDRITRWLKGIVFRREARRMLSGLSSPPALIVDFACGSGLFTTSLAEVAKGARVLGVDFHPEPPRELTGAGYLPVEHAGRLQDSADLVLAMHVLEHDDDPLQLLKRIAAMVRPGGHVVMETPNIDCFWADVFGRWWDAWYFPYHRIHFNRRTLKALAEQAGLVVEREVDISVPSMGRTMAHMLGRPNGLPFILLAALLYPLQWACETATRRPVALRVLARRP